MGAETLEEVKVESATTKSHVSFSTPENGGKNGSSDVNGDEEATGLTTAEVLAYC